jgi:hypothetical protein
MLSTINLKLPIGSCRVKKFTSRFIGPFTVTDIVATGLAYALKLPLTWAYIRRFMLVY